MIDNIDVFLEHHGIKGQKWGIRNKGLGSKDVRLKKGTKVYNISSRAARNDSGQIYTAHNLKDILNYRSKYADSQAEFGRIPVFSNAFTVTNEIRAAGKKAQVEAFKKVWDSDPHAMANAIADAQKDMKFAAAFNSRILKLKRDDIYQKRIMNKGERWIKSKGLQEFNASLAVTQKSISGSKSSVDIGRKIDTTVKQKYFNELSKRGYNAVVDLNDIKNYGSEEPLLIFKGGSSLKKAGSVRLTEDHIRKATELYYSEKKLKAYRDILHK